jgi:hypothetical protein
VNDIWGFGILDNIFYIAFRALENIRPRVYDINVIFVCSGTAWTTSARGWASTSLTSSASDISPEGDEASSFYSKLKTKFFKSVFRIADQNPAAFFG